MAPAASMVFISLLVAALISSPVAADQPRLQDDGWYTWQVDEAGASSAMCCFTWERGESTGSGCDLDGRNRTFSTGGDCVAAPGKLQVYTRIDAGKAVDIRVLSSNCPVSAKTEILDIGRLSAEDNLAWFRNIIEDKRLGKHAREEALFALVMSESDAAFVYLDRLLSRR